MSNKLNKSKSVINLKKENSKNLSKSISEKNLKNIDEKVEKFKQNTNLAKAGKDVKDLLEKGYKVLKNMDDLDEIKLGYHVKIKLKSSKKIQQGGFLVKVIKDYIDGKLEHYIQIKAYNKIYRFNVENISYIFYKEVTPNAKKIEILTKKVEKLEKDNNTKFLKILKLLKDNKIN